jgi:hypothetical protein
MSVRRRVLVGVVTALVALAVYPTWWVAQYHRGAAPIRDLRAKTERAVVVGADRQSVERFFEQEQVPYEHVDYNPVGSEGHALQAHRVVTIPAIGMVSPLAIVVVLDDTDHVTTLVMFQPLHGP